MYRFQLCDETMKARHKTATGHPYHPAVNSDFGDLGAAKKLSVPTETYRFPRFVRADRPDFSDFICLGRCPTVLGEASGHAVGAGATRRD